MPLSAAEQLAAIQQTAFFTALQHQFQAINAAFAANSFTIEGVILTEVLGVPVSGSISKDGTTISVSVGQDDNGKAFYSWNAPAAWVAPTPAPAPAPDPAPESPAPPS